MADFCQQCSIEIFGEDHKDLAKLMPADQYSDDMGAAALCEGCGPTTVDIDGKCCNVGCPKHGAKRDAG